MTCEEENEKYFLSFSYNEVAASFLVFGLGCVTAFVYLAAENIYRRREIIRTRSPEGAEIILRRRIHRLRGFYINTNEHLSNLKKEIMKEPSFEYTENDSIFERLQSQLSQELDKVIHSLQQKIT